MFSINGKIEHKIKNKEVYFIRFQELFETSKLLPLVSYKKMGISVIKLHTNKYMKGEICKLE